MKDFENAGQRSNKYCSDLGTAEIARREDEYPSPTSSQGSYLQRAVTQPLIFGKHYPLVSAHGFEPDLVSFISFEMVIMNLDDEVELDEFGPDRLYAE